MAKIIWTEEASSDYYETLLYWEEHNLSPTYSEKIVENVDATEKLILENPKIGTKTDLPEVFRIRFLTYFSLFYRMRNGNIEILAFWDGRRNPENLSF